VHRDGDAGVIRYRERAHFFRGLGLFVEASAAGRVFSITETPQFTMNGPMIDVSQGNAVPTVATVTGLLRSMALMGLNMLMLYAEDSYDVPEQPYFGSMRGRYSHDEMRAIDDDADALGIELIPCIQTLSHLKDVLKWDAFAAIRDDDETMLVGSEATYAFVEQMIVAASAPVRTKRIHIGMDEAWHLGLGNYLAENGYRSKFEIMNAHLRRVMEIVRRHGLEPMIWSDMYFRAGSRTGDYYDVESHIPRAVMDEVPDDVQLVYWDYYHGDEAFYAEWIRRHKAFGSTPIFAGGIWNWNQIALNYGWTFTATNAALAACKREGVREVIATVWGDDGTECDLHAAMLGLQLFAEHGFAAELDEGKLARRFRFCTGGEMADFRAIGLLDEPPGVPAGNPEQANPSRYLLWQHPLLGLFDANTRGRELGAHYARLAEEMAACAARNGVYGPVFAFYARLCDVLAVKAEVGLRITDAYRGGDRDTLRAIGATELPEVVARVRALRACHRERWHALYAPFGWEVIDTRYGGLLMSLDTAMHRIGEYVAGRIERIAELEEPRLPYQGREGLMRVPYAGRMASASRLVWYEG
ncbi:MAG TPA: beta-N-acetylhexosaminidase, partial [Thermomicrobiales bacterium]|nr:beta-N-acetylhexosaminidase [Thermomicrobiales bacterium]